MMGAGNQPRETREKAILTGLTNRLKAANYWGLCDDNAGERGRENGGEMLGLLLENKRNGNDLKLEEMGQT